MLFFSGSAFFLVVFALNEALQEKLCLFNILFSILSIKVNFSLNYGQFLVAERMHKSL